VNQPEHTNSRALRPRVKGRLIAAATISTGHPARSAMWAIANPVATAPGRGTRHGVAIPVEDERGPRLGFDFGQQGGELIELDDRATHASPPSSSTCATARGCVTMANCSLPSVVALTVVCECNALISLDDGTSGKINMGVVSGGATHLYGELFKMMTGVDMVAVNYRGPAPLLTDLRGRQVDVVFDSLISSIEHIRAGTLRGLAVTSATRLEALPDIPTVGDFVPGYEATAWIGIGAPKNTPAEIIEKLNKEINAALADPKMKARIADLGAEVLAGSPADLGKRIVADTEKWGKVIRVAKIKAQ
jgi:hypothetical protein